MAESLKLGEMDYGQVKISDEVVGTIASIAASEIDGVDGMSGGLTEDLAEMFGKKNLAKGVKVTVEEEVVLIDLNVIVDFGVKIPEVSWEIQENVKNVVEMMTGLKVKEVNVHVSGVNLNKEVPMEQSE